MYKYLLLLFVGCAQVTSLNLKKHQFGQIPTQIVWIQVAGLSEEHLAMLKYSYPSANIKTSFEKSLCIGKTWEYNLYDIRPTAYSGFLSQLTGKKNIKGQCSDYLQKPVWKYLLSRGYKVGVFESQSGPKESLLSSNKCKEGKDYLKDTYFWKMNTKLPSDAKLFHIGEDTQFKPNNIYYDRSCKSGECFSTFTRNIEKTFSQFSKNSKDYLYLIRDFQFTRHLHKNNIKKAKAQLAELEKVIKYFTKFTESSNDFMLLVTTAHSHNVSFPRKGNQWREYEKSGRFIKNKKSQLISPLFVYGARSENFCGIYDQSEILNRIFSGAKQQGLEFTIVNPFSD